MIPFVFSKHHKISLNPRFIAFSALKILIYNAKEKQKFLCFLVLYNNTVSVGKVWILLFVMFAI